MTYVIVSSGSLGALSPEPAADLARRQRAIAAGMARQDLDARERLAGAADKALDTIHNRLNFIIDEQFSLVAIGAKALGTAGASAGLVFAGVKAAAASTALAAPAVVSPAGVFVAGVGLVAAGTAVVVITLPSFADAFAARRFFVQQRDSLEGRVRARVKDACFDHEITTAQAAQRVNEFLLSYAKDIDDQIKVNEGASDIFTNVARSFAKGLGDLLPGPSSVPGWMWALLGLAVAGAAAGWVAGAKRSR